MKKGLTLIELMIVTVLISIIVAASAVVFLTGLKAWSSGRDRTEIREEAGLAMERMVRDLCQAGTITAATTAMITFTADVDNDSVNETVTFSRDAGNNLIRTVDGAAITLTPDARALTFSYTDLNNNGTVPVTQADRNNIRVVTIALTMNKADETYALSSSAYTRNQIP
jgi:prepilin-type N-terminal cleavage/methylation domain-containing protein